VVTPTLADRKQQREDPNVGVPRSIKKERQNLRMSKAKGTRRRLMQPQDGAKRHPFYPTLKQWGAEGVPVNCGPDYWEPAVIQQAVARGPHRSALEPENEATVREDIQYQVDAGFSQIFTWKEVQRLQPSEATKSVADGSSTTKGLLSNQQGAKRQTPRDRSREEQRGPCGALRLLCQN
jgi:hypothetical protein